VTTRKGFLSLNILGNLFHIFNPFFNVGKKNNKQRSATYIGGEAVGEKWVSSAVVIVVVISSQLLVSVAISF